MPSPLSIVIPAAGMGRRMKSYGPKPLIEVAGGETVIARQIRLLGAAFPRADLVVVVGHEAERVARSLPPRVRVAENERHAETNVARSIGIGLRAAAAQRALVVYGDLVFAPEVLAGLVGRGSAVLEGTMGQEEVGLHAEGGRAVNFEYGLPRKWGHMAFLAGAELAEFRRFCCDPARSMCLGFEALNHVLEGGGRLRVVAPAGRLVEIDTSADIASARGIAR